MTQRVICCHASGIAPPAIAPQSVQPAGFAIGSRGLCPSRYVFVVSVGGAAGFPTRTSRRRLKAKQCVFPANASFIFIPWRSGRAGRIAYPLHSMVLRKSFHRLLRAQTEYLCEVSPAAP